MPFTGRIAPVLGILTTVAAVGLTVLPARADVVSLSTGGVVRGRVTESNVDLSHRAPSGIRRAGSGTLSLTTVTGGRLVLESSEVRSVTRRPLALEDYELRSRRTPEEIGALFALAEWCDSKGLKAQRHDALRRILAIDPENAQAHRGLGEARYDGRWKTLEDEMHSRGFVKYEGKYVTPQEVEIQKGMQARRRNERGWTERIRNWSHAVFSSDGEKRRRARTQLLKVNDVQAIPALNHVLRSSENEDARELYVRILANISGPQPIPLLVQQSLFDASKSVRVAAQDMMTPPRRDVAGPLYAHELHNADNEVVRRAALMLDKFGDDHYVPDLIEALVTTHQVPTQVVDNSNSYSFSRNGPVSGPDLMGLPPAIATRALTGQYPEGLIIVPSADQQARVKTVMVDRPFHNAEALAALQSLTRQSFGYDKDQWRRWWAARTTMGTARPFNTSTPAPTTNSTTP